jgi:hypothetical protein
VISIVPVSSSAISSRAAALESLETAFGPQLRTAAIHLPRLLNSGRPTT